MPGRLQTRSRLAHPKRTPRRPSLHGLIIRFEDDSVDLSENDRGDASALSSDGDN
jgi:hypothetical protein